MDSRALRDLRAESEFPQACSPGDDALVGKLVAERYRVVRKLAEGAQASVYVAKHTLIKRLVALKVLSPSVSADSDLVRRFLDEGQVAGTMGHPNIVESLDMGVVEDGRPFLVLEYLDGTTIADELHRRGALDLGRASYIGMQIASALAATHARGIVHRDLKPENVFLIDRDGRGDHVKVLDFGISKLESRKEGSARAGLVVGTPDYMAPEQVTDPASVDARADVFALGAMLYEMLSGRLPLDASADEDVLDVVVRRTPAPLGRICPHLPPQVLAAVELAMHKDRSKRTQTIAEVGAILEKFAVASPAASVSSLPAAALALNLPKLSGVQTLDASPDSARISGVGSVASASAAPSSPSITMPGATSTTALSASEPRASEHPIPAAAVSTVSVVATTAAVVAFTPPASAAGPAHARAAVIGAAAPSSARGLEIGIVVGVLAACAAGGLVFVGMRASVLRAPIGSVPTRIEATPSQAGPATPAVAIAAQAATANAARPGAVAASTAVDAKGVALPVPPKGAVGKDGPRSRELAGAVALASAEARRAQEKADREDKAAEAAARSAPAPSPFAAAPAQPDPTTQAAPAAPTKASILPFGEGMTRPVSISPDEIQYTREAREAKVAGTMIVRCLITTEGSLQNCRIMKSVPMMDEAVLSALARHRGAPVMYQGHPVSVEYTYTIRLKQAD